MQSTGATITEHIKTSPKKRQKCTGLKCRNSLPHIQILMHIDTRKEQVTLECIRRDQTPISTGDNHHNAQIKIKSSGQTQRKL